VDLEDSENGRKKLLHAGAVFVGEKRGFGLDGPAFLQEPFLEDRLVKRGGFEKEDEILGHGRKL
jgi:hypothetical protein